MLTFPFYLNKKNIEMVLKVKYWITLNSSQFFLSPLGLFPSLDLFGSHYFFFNYFHVYNLISTVPFLFFVYLPPDSTPSPCFPALVKSLPENSPWGKLSAPLDATETLWTKKKYKVRYSTICELLLQFKSNFKCNWIIL